MEQLCRKLTETFEATQAVEAIEVTETTEAKILLLLKILYIECLWGPKRPFMPDLARRYHPDKFVIIPNFVFDVKIN